MIYDIKTNEITQIMLDATPLCCIMWDENFHSINCNEEAVKLFELSSKQEYLDRFFELSPEYQPDGSLSSEKAVKYFQQAFDTGRVVFEWMHQKLNGDPIPSEITMVRVKCGDSYIFVGYTRDLREYKKMITTTTEFLANMSHEIRTPMNAIIGMAELLLREETSPTIRENALGIRQAGANLLGIINDILDFSKIESGNMDLVLAEYTLSSLINDVIHTIKARAHESRLRFVVNIDNNIPNILEGDAKRIRQIMLNLLSNAVKYTDNGYISLVVNGIMTDENKLTLIIEVSDSGVGIKQQDLDKLFDKFVRLDNASNKNVEGTGLGLAITKSFVNTMGGEIDVRSTRGVGSTFTVKLPQKIKDHKKLAVVENLEEKNVLIFEQREICKNSIIQTMDGLGVSYRLVTTTAEFFKELLSNKYTFIFVATALYERAKHEYGELKTNAKVVLVSEFGEIVKERNVCVLSTPIYAIPVADFLNNVSDFAAGSAINREGARWIAPEARILSVDDIVTNLTVLKALLRPYKVRVVSCKSGMEAIEAVKAVHFDLVFMDHMMPGMDGIETTQRIRALKSDYPHLEKVPIVALSANAVLGMKEKFLHNGLNDFLSKPIDLVKLNGILRKWIPEDKWVTSEEKDNKKEPEPISNIEISGVNVNKGIAMTGGTIENYIKTLAIFHMDCLEKNKEIKLHLDTLNLPLFTICVHALKSAAANIGADNLSETAGVLEKAGIDEDISLIKSKGMQLLADLEEIINSINKVLVKTNNNEQSIPVDMESIKEELRGLKAAINSFDAISIKKSSDNLQKYTHIAGIGATIDEIQKCVLKGDDDKALSLIASIIQENRD